MRTIKSIVKPTTKQIEKPAVHTILETVVLGLSLFSLTTSVGCQTQRLSTQHLSGENQLIRSNYSSGELTQLCTQAIETAKTRLDSLLKPRAQESSLLLFEKIITDLGDATSPLTFMSYVSTDEKINKEGSDCEQEVNQFAVTIFTRKDLYQLLKSEETASAKTLSHPEKRLMSETLKSFEENGLNLPDDRLKEVRELKQKLAVIESQFSTHLNQDHSTVELSPDELEGIPTDFIAGLPKSPENAGKFIIAVNEPNYIRVMDNATRSETRKKMLSAYENRAAKENSKLLEDAILLRQKVASILGYETWADYRVFNRMAKNSKTVLEFLNSLKKKLVSRNQQDLNRLLELKKKLDPTAKVLDAWDIRYLSNQLKKKNYSLDDEQIREYFPAELVFAGMFKVYSQLLSVDFIEDTSAKTWAEGVKLYKIQDSKTHEVISYFYSDFLPRKGKYGHAAAFTLISGRQTEDGKYSHPISAIVANFSAAEPGKPILLKHDEVRTLFHEFGHIMHQTLTRAPYASLSGSSVDHDFVEAPSQMLENWVYSEEVLTLLSGHYKDHNKKLPVELLKKIIETRDFNQGHIYTRQLLFGLLDMNFHTHSGPVDTALTYSQLFHELMGMPAIEGTHFPASFGHLMGGYDAGYYGYLWSEVYAADMFTRFEKEGLLSSKTGSLYRNTILEQGKMVDSQELVEKFLGRKSNTHAFYKKLHIQ